MPTLRFSMRNRPSIINLTTEESMVVYSVSSTLAFRDSIASFDCSSSWVRSLTLVSKLVL